MARLQEVMLVVRSRGRQGSDLVLIISGIFTPRQQWVKLEERTILATE